VEVNAFIPGIAMPSALKNDSIPERESKYKAGKFCIKTNWAVIAVFSLSWLVLLCGILMLIFSVAFNGNSVIENMERENDDIKDGRKFIFTCAVIFSVVTILLGAFGFVHHCVKHKAFPMIYGMIIFPSFIFLLIVGGVSVASFNAFLDSADEECAVVASNYANSIVTFREKIQLEAEAQAA